MPKRGRDADNRIFFDQLASLTASRLRATGAIRLEDRHGVIAFGDKQKFVGVAHTIFPNGGAWSYLNCPRCGGRKKKLWLVDDAPRCLSCCWSLGVRYRSAYGFGRTERLIERDRYVDRVQDRRLRERKRRLTMTMRRSMNALRGHLAEFGVIAAKGISHVEELVERAAAADLPAMVQATLGVLLAQLRSLDAATDELERAIVANHRRDPVSRLAASVPGVGALAASAILASAPDPQAFKSGRDFAAWLGATPKQNSTGGKEKFGSITKQGNRYIRRLLVLGAISVLRAAPKRKGALCDWLAALRARKPAKVVAVALANKLARIVWAIITTGEAFRTSIYAKA